MKHYLKILMLIFVAAISLTAVSCGDDNDEPIQDDNSIVGKWICENFDEGCDYIICFDSNGTGWMRWTDGDEKEVFSYRDQNNHLTFYSYDEWSSESWECDYEIRNKNNLTIYGNPWGEDDDINVVHFRRM